MNTSNVPPGEKVDRSTIVADVVLPKLNARELQKWSPIRLGTRQRVEAAFNRVDAEKLATPHQIDGILAPMETAANEVARAATAGYIELGRWFVRLRRVAPHGTFLKLFKGSPEAKFPTYDVKTVQSFMRIVEHPVLGHPKNWPKLPIASHVTMDTLTRVGQVKDLDLLMREGRITPRTTKRQAQSLLPTSTAPSDPLAPVRAAIHFYEGPRAALITCLREELKDLETPVEVDEVEVEVEVEEEAVR